MIITVIGNDSRQREVARLFNQKYDTIYLSGTEEINIVKSILKISDKIILPLPLTRDNQKINSTEFSISEIIKAIPEDATVFAGMCNNVKFKCKTADYNEFEDFTLKNAFYTAEAAVALSIINTTVSLSDANILILGNGRIGKYLGKFLAPLCKSITISARKQKDFDYIKAKGHSYIDSNEIKNLSAFDIIFNTVPARIVLPEALSTLSKNALIIDLASKNSGLFSDNINYIDAKALPAKYCKESTAKALFNSVSKYF